jgi:hypothetical protein
MAIIGPLYISGNLLAIFVAVRSIDDQILELAGPYILNPELEYFFPFLGSRWCFLRFRWPR